MEPHLTLQTKQSMRLLNRLLHLGRLDPQHTQSVYYTVHTSYTVKFEPRLPRKRPHHILDTPSVIGCAQVPVSPPPTAAEGRGPSPYTLVDQFITRQLNRGGVQGTIRRWTFFPQGMVVLG